MLRARAAIPEDREFLAKACRSVTTSGYHETAEGFLEAIDDGVVTPVVFENGRLRGVALVCIFRAGRNEKSLYLAAMYGEPDATDEERDEAMAKIDNIAKHNGCSRVTFNSTRKGWGRRMARYGFRLSPYVSYERSVG